MSGIDQHQLKATLGQHIPDRFPVLAGRLHHHMTYLVFSKPIGQPVDLRGDRRERLHLRYPLTPRPRNPQANNNFGLPDVDTGTPANHYIHT
jgi:hypothetical protein